LPVFFLSALGAIIHFVRHPGLHSGWLFLLSVAATIAVLKTRFYAVRVQDRIIRLEERLRLMTLLAEPLRSRIPELTESQLIAIRFACDTEVSACVERALARNLSRADIKRSIQVWRPDYWRV
jgi:uncharacterized protein DUF6526